MSKEADEIKGLYFPCLDHGFVALIDYMGDDAAVVQAARSSYGAGTKTFNEDRGLLRYMKAHRHSSPFEMVELKFHVRLPIFVARQLIRHRTANVNEYSLRYSLPIMQFYVPRPEDMGSQSKKNKQGRATPIDDAAAKAIVARWEYLQREAQELYEIMISPNIDLARELARMHLPVSLYTEWYWKIDLHNLLHFLNLRSDSHAQWEIQQVSNLKAAICQRVAPLAFEAWLDYEFQSRTFSRMEMQLLRMLIKSRLAADEDGKSWTQLLATGFVNDVASGHLGLTKREWGQLVETFEECEADPYERKTFELDISKAKTAEWFAEEAKKYLPKQQ